MEGMEKYTYTIDDKTGRIIKVEEALEKQKQQKQALRVKIAALCATIAISGIGIFSLNQQQEKKNNNTSTENTLSDNELESISKMEDYLQDAQDGKQKEIMSEVENYLNDYLHNDNSDREEKNKEEGQMRIQLLQGVYNATFNYYNGGPVNVDGFDTSNTYGQTFTEDWANSDDAEIAEYYKKGKEAGIAYQKAMEKYEIKNEEIECNDITISTENGRSR